MPSTQLLFGPVLVKKIVRFVVTFVGLLVLRAVLSALPMLANASSIGDTLMSPLVIADAVVDTLLLVVLLQFGVSTGRAIAANATRFTDAGKMLSLAILTIVLLIAYYQYQTPIACLVISPADLPKAGQSNMRANDLEAVIRTLTQGIATAEVGMATGTTLAVFQKIGVMVLRQPPDIYGWTFLILIAFPVIGIVILVSRNLEILTETLFRAASASPTVVVTGAFAEPQCRNCGRPIQSTEKFCSNCGTASTTPTSLAAARRLCTCGADNPAGARFCGACGRAA